MQLLERGEQEGCPPFHVRDKEGLNSLIKQSQMCLLSHGEAHPWGLVSSFKIVTMLYITPPGLLCLMTRSVHILPACTHFALIS